MLWAHLVKKKKVCSREVRLKIKDAVQFLQKRVSVPR